MSAVELLGRLHDAGFDLIVNGEKLEVSPASKLNDELRAMLRELKPQLIRVLTHTPANDERIHDPRACDDCKNNRRGTCGEPVVAGLGESFGIVWPPLAHAQHCIAFEPTRKVAERSFRLTTAEAETAHREQWDDVVIARFQRRLTLLLQRGLTVQGADDLAERLHLHDVDLDDRRMCFECLKCQTNRCSAGEVFLGAQLQRCPQFKEQYP
jgi:hypothetical protein